MQLAKHTHENNELDACKFINCELSQGQCKTCRLIECRFEHCNL
ncbi:pentapeptide repeat-containing protein, partial [Pseudoalteromonas sp. S1691]